MFIVIPTERGQLAGHFGRCREVSPFGVDPTARRIENDAILDMPPHEPSVFPVWLRIRGVEMMIADGIMTKALALCAQQGIEALLGINAQTAGKLAPRFLSSALSDGVNTWTHSPHHPYEHDSETAR